MKRKRSETTPAMSGHDRIKAMLEENRGFITSSQVTKAGIQRRILGELVTANIVCRVARGIYSLPDVWEDEMYFLQYRFSKGVFSNETALYLHGLSDWMPQAYTLTFPRGYNALGLKKHNAKAKFVVSELYDLGVSEKIASKYCKQHVF